MKLGVGLVLSLAAMKASANEFVNNQYVHDVDVWTGVYVGAYFGAGSDNNVNQTFSSKGRFQQILITPTTTSTTVSLERTHGSLNGDATGSVANLFVGYNFRPRCTNFVFGAQLEGTVFNDITLKENGMEHSNDNQTQTTVSAAETTVTTTSSITNSTTTSSDELHSTIGLVARAGYLVTPCILAYGLVGVLEGNFVAPENDDPTGGRRSQWETGYTLGAGLEYKFNPNWSLFAEYRFIHFDIDRNQSTVNSSLQFQPDNRFLNQGKFSQHSSTALNFNMGNIGVVFRFC